VSRERVALAAAVTCDDLIYVLLEDGRLVTYPLTDRLRKATPGQRRNCRIEDFGAALHWPDVDEDLGVNTILGVSEEAMLRLAYRRQPRARRTPA
jgi:hypothetical protein